MSIRTFEQENSEELHIIRDAFNSKFPPFHGSQSDSFLYHLSLAFVKADRENFELLRPVIAVIISKYDLKCTCEVEKHP